MIEKFLIKLILALLNLLVGKVKDEMEYQAEIKEQDSETDRLIDQVKQAKTRAEKVVAIRDLARNSF